MKTRHLIAILGLVLSLQACDDDSGSYTQIKAVEHQIYLELRDYRETNGLDGPFVHQVLMVEEAQRYAHKMAIGLEEVGTQGMDEHWDELSDSWDFYNRTGLVLETPASDAVKIVEAMLARPGADSTLLGDLTQSGVGVASGENGLNYIAVFLAKAD